MAELGSLRTPAFLVDKNVVAHNTKKMLENASRRGLGIRPHMKTHKTLEAAKLIFAGQEEGKKKIVVSTLAEVKFYADAGYKDILYAVPIALSKIPEVAAFIKSGITVHVFVDNFVQINALVEFFDNNPGTRPWSCFLKIDCGNHRAGLEPTDPDNLELARALAHDFKEKIDFQGIYAHAGHSYKSKTVEEIRRHAEGERDALSQLVETLKEKVNVHCKVVSIGSTPTCSHLPGTMGKITEIHPGNYVFYDWMQAELGTCTLDEVAVSVLARVVGHYPKRNQFLVDAGSLALSSDLGNIHLHRRPEYGAIKGATHLRVVAVTQELGKVETEDGSPLDFSKFPIGSLVQILPNHSCLTAALYEEYHVVEKGVVLEKWKPVKGW